MLAWDPCLLGLVALLLGDTLLRPPGATNCPATPTCWEEGTADTSAAAAGVAEALDGWSAGASGCEASCSAAGWVVAAGAGSAFCDSAAAPCALTVAF
jgi:hypothetical protein